ncbi:MAG: HypC/HybG/HupF family hydrogenase formation chaperone [Methanophagales archaeon]|nr:HypC/HybG/HupF family hydrogenase formation chaperone [Methanophagales archaeon]
MCLAIPAKVVEITGEEGIRRKAKADFGGVSREIDITLVDAKVGDYVIVHAGFAIAVLDEQEARETLALWWELLEESF